MKTPTLLNIRILLTILMLGMGSSVWADGFVYTLTVPSGTSISSYDETKTVTVNDIRWSLPGYISGSTWRIGGGKATGDGKNRTLQSKDPLNAIISKITVKHNGKSSNDITINSVILTVATDATFSEESLIDKRKLSSSLNIAKDEDGSFSFTPNQYSPKWPKGCYYKITINYKNSSSDNGGLNLISIQFEDDTEAEYPKNFTWLSSSLEGSADGTEVGKVTADDAPVSIAFGAGTGVTPTYNATQKGVLLKVRNQITVSAPEGYAINGITVHHTGNSNAFTPSISTCINKEQAPDGSKYAQKWTGLSPHVTLTWGFNLNNFYIYRLHVSYVPLAPAGSITVNPYGTTTYCPCETPLVVGDGTLTMMATGTDENVIVEENIPVMPIGTGVLIHGANQTYQCYTSADLSTPPTATLNRNLLTGVTAADGVSAPVGSYVLQYHSDEGFGFYQVDDFQPTVDHGKAYLTLPPSGAKVIYFTQEEADQHATAIHATAADDAPTGAIHHLSGVRLSQPQKGFNIIRRTDGTVIKKVLP